MSSQPIEIEEDGYKIIIHYDNLMDDKLIIDCINEQYCESSSVTFTATDDIFNGHKVFSSPQVIYKAIEDLGKDDCDKSLGWEITFNGALTITLTFTTPYITDKITLVCPLNKKDQTAIICQLISDKAQLQDKVTDLANKIAKLEGEMKTFENEKIFSQQLQKMAWIKLASDDASFYPDHAEKFKRLFIDKCDPQWLLAQIPVQHQNSNNIAMHHPEGLIYVRDNWTKYFEQIRTISILDIPKFIDKLAEEKRQWLDISNINQPKQFPCEQAKREWYETMCAKVWGKN